MVAVVLVRQPLVSGLGCLLVACWLFQPPDELAATAREDHERWLRHPLGRQAADALELGFEVLFGAGVHVGVKKCDQFDLVLAGLLVYHLGRSVRRVIQVSRAVVLGDELAQVLDRRERAGRDWFFAVGDRRDQPWPSRLDQLQEPNRRQVVWAGACAGLAVEA